MTTPQVAQANAMCPVADGTDLGSRLQLLDTTGIPVIPIGVNTENALHAVELRSLWKSDFSAVLPATAASGELGLINGAAGASYLRGETSATTKANTGRFHFVLPPRYVAASDLTLVLHAKTLSAPVTSAGIVVTAYKMSGEAGVGSNLGPASIAVTAVYGDKSFTITGASLAPGDCLDILITANIADNGSNNYVIIGSLKMTVPSRAI
jgi:hypothetical protein